MCSEVEGQWRLCEGAVRGRGSGGCVRMQRGGGAVEVV